MILGEVMPVWGFGPPAWSKYAITFDDAGHLCGSYSWYRDLLTSLEEQILMYVLLEMKMALDDHHPFVFF